ncbi:MAG: hypothetical protein KDC44_18995, partial [Phaeodactylibacter sp.]|nr:hypothetical protein [Phaeodactylibacter sp.]
MQDNYNNNFSSEFTQEAWEQMRGILDVEMPEERQRRPLLLWLLFGLLPALLLILGGSVLLQDSAFLPSAPAEMPVSPAAAPKPQLGEVPVAFCPEDRPSEPSNPALDLHPKGSTAPAFTSQKRPAYSPNPESTQLWSAADPTPTLVDRPAQLAAEPLSAKAIALLTRTAPSIEPQMPTTVTVEPNSKRNMEWGLRATWHNPIFLRPSGVELAAETAFPLGKSRWSLETGLGYYTTNWERSSSLLNSFVRADEEALGLDPSTNFEDFYNGVTADEVESKTSNIGGNVYYPARLHYLTLPIGMSYRLGTRLHLRGGAQLRYLIANRFVQ